MLLKLKFSPKLHISKPKTRVKAIEGVVLPAPMEHVQKVQQQVKPETLNISQIETKEAPSIVADETDFQFYVQQQKMRYYADLAGVILQLSFGVLLLMMIVTSIRGGMGRGGPGGINNFISGKVYEKTPEELGVTFADVAGLEGAKEELKEVVDFLKNPEKYVSIGAKIPKGCLLAGGPGLGKTLLAKAVAGEAGVPFLSCSAAEFIEMFVGVGASRIRDMFKKAKEKAPCIVFIDEIDAIGRSRSANNGFANNDERDQTINQLLTEMDGFDSKKGIVVLAATNRPEILDSALVRPGRFDRQIVLDLPGLKAREEILKVHSKGKPLKEDVSLESIAKITAGFSGAELMNLMNESAILTARKGDVAIGMQEIEGALERIILGLEKKDAIVSQEKKALTAYHEAGHAVVALKIGEYDTIKKVTIIPRGRAAGVTVFEQDSDKIESGMYSKRYLENQLAVALGGRVAEELVVGNMDMTTGASSDLEKVQQIARAMVMRFGFSEKLGPVSWKDGNKLETNYSERTLYEIDTEVKKMAGSAYTRAKNILINNKDLLKKVAELLIEKETITGKEVEDLDKTTKRFFPQT